MTQSPLSFSFSSPFSLFPHIVFFNLYLFKSLSCVLFQLHFTFHLIPPLFFVVISPLLFIFTLLSSLSHSLYRYHTFLSLLFPSLFSLSLSVRLIPFIFSIPIPHSALSPFLHSYVPLSPSPSLRCYPYSFSPPLSLSLFILVIAIPLSPHLLLLLFIPIPLPSRYR